MSGPATPGEGASAPRRLAGLALVLACTSFAFDGILRPAAGGFEGFIDFAPYYKGAAALARGLDPYDLAVTDRLGEELGVTEGKEMRYLYPPFFGLVAAPLTLLPYPVAKAAWHALGLAFLAGAVVLLPGALLPAPGGWERGIALFLAATFLPIVETLRLGQVNLLLLLLLVLAIRDLGRGREGRAGLAVGLAAAIKVTPALILPLFLLRRRWKGLAAGAGSAAGLTLLGFLLAPAGSWGSFSRTVLPWYANGHSWIANQSPQGFLLRLLGGSAALTAPD
ncbi:MAG: glycosyltransferase family 87 protein, partial [Planctomycetota bacterium]